MMGPEIDPAEKANLETVSQDDEVSDEDLLRSVDGEVFDDISEKERERLLRDDEDAGEDQPEVDQGQGRPPAPTVESLNGPSRYQGRRVPPTVESLDQSEEMEVAIKGRNASSTVEDDSLNVLERGQGHVRATPPKVESLNKSDSEEARPRPPTVESLNEESVVDESLNEPDLVLGVEDHDLFDQEDGDNEESQDSKQTEVDRGSREEKAQSSKSANSASRRSPPSPDGSQDDQLVTAFRAAGRGRARGTGMTAVEKRIKMRRERRANRSGNTSEASSLGVPAPWATTKQKPFVVKTNRPGPVFTSGSSSSSDTESEGRVPRYVGPPPSVQQLNAEPQFRVPNAPPPSFNHPTTESEFVMPQAQAPRVHPVFQNRALSPPRGATPGSTTNVISLRPQSDRYESVGPLPIVPTPSSSWGVARGAPLSQRRRPSDGDDPVRIPVDLNAAPIGDPQDWRLDVDDVKEELVKKEEVEDDGRYDLSDEEEIQVVEVVPPKPIERVSSDEDDEDEIQCVAEFEAPKPRPANPTDSDHQWRASDLDAFDDERSYETVGSESDFEAPRTSPRNPGMTVDSTNIPLAAWMKRHNAENFDRIQNRPPQVDPRLLSGRGNVSVVREAQKRKPEFVSILNAKKARERVKVVVTPYPEAWGLDRIAELAKAYGEVESHAARVVDGVKGVELTFESEDAAMLCKGGFDNRFVWKNEAGEIVFDDRGQDDEEVDGFRLSAEVKERKSVKERLGLAAMSKKK